MNRRANRPGKPSVCFVSLHNFHVLCGDANGRHIGGAEVQQAYVARGLVRRGYPVSFVTSDHGQEDGVAIDGIRVFKACTEDAGIGGIRFIHPRWTSLWRAMRRADADIYYQRMASDESGKACSFCCTKRRKFVFAVAHDSNCDPLLPGLATLRERVLYRFALRYADAVISQTSQQQAALRQFFRRESSVVRSCIALRNGRASTEANRPPAGRPRILWAGRFSREKRPEWCLQLAEAIPECDFDIVGGSIADAAYEKELRHRASSLSNVTLHGVVPHRMMPEFYRKASVLLCTSDAEGFPNIFLEAWAHGRPVVSSVDPDRIIRTHAVGWTAESVEGLHSTLMCVVGDETAWAMCAENGLRYIAAHHSMDRVLDEYERIFCGLSGE